VEIHIKKVGMIRPQNNPKNQDVNLKIDWSIDYIHKSQSNVEYICNILTFPNFPLNLRIEGFLYIGNFEKFSEDDLSKIIFDKCMDVLLNLISITKDQIFEIPSKEEILENNKYDAIESI
jgi:hypothetical protein